VLCVSQVLNGPLVLLLGILLSLLSVFIYLGRAGGHNLFFLIWPQTLEVVGHIPVRSELALSCFSILSHNVAHVSSMDLTLVHVLLSIPPFFLSLFFFIGEPLIVLSELFKLLFLLHRHIILHHATHSGYGVGLFGVVGIFFSIQLVLPLMLPNLFFNPLLLHLSIRSHALSEV